MDSDANSSFLAPSTTQLSSRSGSKQTRGPSSSVWDYCRPPLENEDQSKKHYCTLCKDPNVTPYGAPYPSNMRKHILIHHKIVVPIEPSQIQTKTLEKLQQLYAQAKDSGQTEEIDNQVFSDYLNQDVVYEALVSLIVNNNLSHSLVESSDFHVFCQVLNPKASDVVPQAHSTVRKKIFEAFSTHKDVV